MKREGTYKTPKQLEEQARAMARLEAMKAQGITIPTTKPGHSKDKNKRNQNAARRNAMRRQQSDKPGKFQT